MAESPTAEEVKVERPDIESMIKDNDSNLDLDDYIAKALTHVQRDLRERKSIQWVMVYSADDGDYWPDADGNENNKDSIIHMITLLTIAFVFKDYSISVEDSSYWDLYLAYRSDYDTAINQAKLDIDWNESGGITTDEEKQTTQTFLSV